MPSTQSGNFERISTDAATAMIVMMAFKSNPRHHLLQVQRLSF
jgi:hypothetical protein